MNKVKLCFLCGMLLLFQATKASFVFSENCIRAYEEMFQLRFIPASQLLDAEKKTNPQNKIPLYIESYIDFLKAFISEEDKDYNTLKENHEKRFSLLDKEDKSSPWYLLVKGEMEMQLAFLRIKNKEYVSGALAIRRSYKMLEENHKKFPSFLPDLKCLGLVHAFIGAVPDNYRWLLKLAGMQGSIRQGISELNYFASATVSDPHYAYLNNEAGLLLLFSKTHLEKDEAGAAVLADSLRTSADSPLEIFSVGNYYAHAAKNDTLISLLNRNNFTSDYPLVYLDWMRGTTRLNRLDTTARQYYLRYIAHFHGKSFIKASYQKVAWIALMEQDTFAYRKMMTYCKNFGDDFTDEDKQALKEATTGEMPNVILLKSRLLFDGGYYRESLLQIANKPTGNFPRLRDQVEFPYRLARIFDKTGEKEKAISSYITTISNGKAHPFYFAANAALQLGLIYEEKKDYTNAEKYYRECLSMRNHEYQNSLDQKARAGLNRLGK